MRKWNAEMREKMRKLQKKLLVCLLLVCMVLPLGACGSAVEAAKQALEKKKQEEGQTTEEEVTDDEVTEDVEEEAGDSEELSVSLDHPVLGEDDIADYDGFEYLYCENLRTQSEKNEETGKMESYSMDVFIPQDDYVYVNMNRVTGDKLGVSFRIELNPSIRYAAEDYLVSENLQYYVENEFDPFYSDGTKDVVIGEPEEIDRNTARQTVEYLLYNKYEASLTPVFSTYYLKEFEDGRTAMVCFDVSADEVTGKTPELLEELEAFYQFEIDWDKDAAQKKLEDYEASGGDSTFATDFVMFTLPDGWDKDYDVSSYDNFVYAPEGDAVNAQCFIMLQKEYMGYGEMEGVDLSDEESLKGLSEMVKEQYGASGDVKASYYGDTCLGEAILVEMTAQVEEGITGVYNLYLIFDDSYMYEIMAAAGDGAEENPFVIVEDILQNGQVPD